LKHELLIYRRQGNKVAKYPSISITSLKKNELSRLETALNNLK